jgi:uncharacterized lipoprotein YajG
MKRTLVFMLALILLAGCATRYNTGNSFVGDIPKEASQRIAADAVAYLSSLYPPGHTTINLVTTKELSNFRQAFENGLRAAGFTLSRDGSETISVAYVLDGLDKASAYLQLVIADPNQGKMTVTRAYSINGEPEAGISTTKVEE